LSDIFSVIYDSPPSPFLPFRLLEYWLAAGDRWRAAASAGQDPDRPGTIKGEEGSPLASSAPNWPRTRREESARTAGCKWTKGGQRWRLIDAGSHWQRKRKSQLLKMGKKRLFLPGNISLFEFEHFLPLSLICSGRKNGVNLKLDEENALSAVLAVGLHVHLSFGVEHGVSLRHREAIQLEISIGQLLILHWKNNGNSWIHCTVYDAFATEPFPDATHASV